MYEAHMSDEVMYVLKCGIVTLAWIIGEPWLHCLNLLLQVQKYEFKDMLIKTNYTIIV
jgi:hypothetical protein